MGKIFFWNKNRGVKWGQFFSSGTEQPIVMKLKIKIVNYFERKMGKVFFFKKEQGRGNGGNLCPSENEQPISM